MSDRRLDVQAVAVDEAFVCGDCAHRWYYTRSRCPNCNGDTVSTYALGEGELVAVTTVAVTPPDVRSPNWLGHARFGEVQLIGQLTEDATVGDRVVFTGAHRLREGDEEENPRLTVIGE